MLVYKFKSSFSGWKPQLVQLRGEILSDFNPGACDNFADGPAGLVGGGAAGLDFGGDLGRGGDQQAARGLGGEQEQLAAGIDLWRIANDQLNTEDRWWVLKPAAWRYFGSAAK